MQDNSVIELKNYGHIRFHVKEIMDKQGITRGALSRLANVRYEVAQKWYDGNLERIDTDVLARICYALNCDLHDILSYEKHI